MSPRRRKRKTTLRVPNPKAPARGRLRTPPHKVHRSKKRYRRKAKHPQRESE